MRKIFFTCLILSVFAFGAAEAQKRPTKARETVKIQAAPLSKTTKTVEAPKTVGLTVERYVSNHEVKADGTAVQTIEIRQRFDSEIALARFAKFERVFNADLEDIEVLEAFVVKPDGAKTPVAVADIKKRLTPQAEAAPAFSSLKTILIEFKNLKLGDAVAFKYQSRSHKPVFERSFSEMEVFTSLFNWKSIEVNLSAPADFPLYTQAVDLSGGRIADEQGRARWRWTRENFVAGEVEEMNFDFVTDSPRLAITSFKDLDQLGAAFWAEAKKKSVVTPEIQALADEITRDISDPRQQANAIYEWVNRNIRYLLIVLDRGGWIPHDTAQILANRYGDCKDYTTLIHALLKAKGIESYPVLIRSDFTYWFPEVAVPDFVNHAILYIPSLNLFADATAPNTRLGQIPQTLVGKQAFLGGEKTGKITVPPGKPEDNQVLSEMEINVLPDGGLKAVSKNVYVGRSEMVFRPLFADSFAAGNSETFVSLILAHYGLSGRGKILKLGDAHKVGEPFGVEMEVSLENYLNFFETGEMTIPSGLNFVNLLEFEQFAKRDRRRTALVVGAATIRESFTINFPSEMTISRVPAPLSFANKLGSYRVEFRRQGNSVTALRELIIREDHVTPAEYPLFRELIQKAIASHAASFGYLADKKLVRQSRSTVAKKNPAAAPKTPADYFSQLSESLDEKPLSPKAVANLEAGLKKNPLAIETRKRLLRHYFHVDVEGTKTNVAARTRHRLWFVVNHPEMNSRDIYPLLAPTDLFGDNEYELLKAAWLKQVETRGNDKAVRLNAADFFDSMEWQTAEKILLDGERLDPESYEFPLELAEIYRRQRKKSETPEEKSKFLARSFAAGERALVLLKRARSAERDSNRAELLPALVQEAFELEKLELAKTLATELVLEFGSTTAQRRFDTAAHTANIIFGRIALREGDLAKAKEYLLISIRAPLRDEASNLVPDLKLAQELFAKGEKETVSEYLKLCGELSNFKKYKNLYDTQINALKLWQEQIKQGKTPSFDFEKP